MTTDDCPPHGIERPDYTDLLASSIEAIHLSNTGRPIRCCCGCDVTYLSAAEYMRHQSRLIHPSGLL